MPSALFLRKPKRNDRPQVTPHRCCNRSFCPIHFLFRSDTIHMSRSQQCTKRSVRCFKPSPRQSTLLLQKPPASLLWLHYTKLSAFCHCLFQQNLYSFCRCLLQMFFPNHSLQSDRIFLSSPGKSYTKVLPTSNVILSDPPVLPLTPIYFFSVFFFLVKNPCIFKLIFFFSPTVFACRESPIPL